MLSNGAVFKILLCRGPGSGTKSIPSNLQKKFFYDKQYLLHTAPLNYLQPSARLKNGAGKTTLIKLLCGIYVPAAGNILLNGIEIRAF